jgi:hypothetical protein
MTEPNGEADGDYISTHEQNVRDLLNQFDDATDSAAAYARYPRIVSQLEIMRDTAQRFDGAMLAIAARAVPDGVGLDGLLAASFRIPVYLNIVLPEVVTDFAIGNIVDTLKLLNSELNDSISDGDAAHLANALGPGFRT